MWLEWSLTGLAAAFGADATHGNAWERMGTPLTIVLHKQSTQHHCLQYHATSLDDQERANSQRL